MRAGRTPATVFGFVIAAFGLRRGAGTTPFTVQSRDNISENGHVAKTMFGAFARLLDAELAEWIETYADFPNSVVDRITPATADADRTELETETGIIDAWPVVAEPIFQWVLEDSFTNGRPDYEQAGVQVVEDVRPYEHTKLRLLNSGHQGLAYCAILAGHTYAHQATLIERFSNPEVRDTLARLGAESSDRIPRWLVPVINDNLACGDPVEVAAAICASWARCAEGTGEHGEAFTIVDRYADRLRETAGTQDQDPLACLRQDQFFGTLAEAPRFTEPSLAALRSLHERAAAENLRRLAACEEL